MRTALPEEDLVGKVCVCSIGRPGVVVAKANLGWGETWVGLALDTHPVRTWASREPLVVAESLEEFWTRSKRATGEAVVLRDGLYVLSDPPRTKPNGVKR